eukprot:ANDGO_01965.mRNA.1 Dynein-1-beta heavy chain
MSDNNRPQELRPDRRRPPTELASAALSNSQKLENRLAFAGTIPNDAIQLPMKRAHAGSVLNTEKKGKNASSSRDLPPAKAQKIAPRAEVEQILGASASSAVSRPGLGAPLRSGKLQNAGLGVATPMLMDNISLGAMPQMDSNPVLKFIEKIRNSQDSLEFVYLRPVFRDIKAPYNPYDLEIVPYSEIQGRDYFTLSGKGVTHFVGGEAEFTPLDQWEREYRLFHRVLSISFFAQYRRWKSFYVWKSWIRSKKRAYCNSVLSANLFVLDDCLRKALLEVRKSCYKLSTLRLYKMSKSETFTLTTFLTSQHNQKESVAQKLEKAVEQIRVVVREACEQFMERDTSATSGSSVTGQTLNNNATSSHAMGEESAPMSYTQLSAKRAKCRRLFSFIRLADFLVVDSLLNLLLTSVSDMFHQITDLHTRHHFTAQISDVDHASSSSSSASSSSVMETFKAASSMSSLFSIELVFRDDALSCNPTGNSFQTAMETVLKSFIESVAAVPRLSSHDDFQPFILPAISDRGEDVEVGEGPDVAALIAEDEHYAELAVGIRDTLGSAFQDVEKYMEAFERFRILYLENRKMDIYRIREEDHPLEFFSDAMAKYRKQKEEIEGIEPRKDIGVFHVDSTKMKETFLPSPINCLKDIQDLLPVLAKSKNEALLAEISQSNMRLSTAPSSTEEFVNYLSFLQTVSEKMEEFEMKFQAVSDIYSLMEEQKIKVPPDEYSMYNMGTVPKFSMLKTTLQFCEDTKDDNINKFADNLEDTIASTRKDVVRTVEQSRSEKLNDPLVPVADALSFVTNLQRVLTDIKKKSKQFVEHQAMFNRPLANFDDVDEALVEVNLKQKLFKSLDDWSSLVTSWKSSKFFKINMEDVSNETQRYVKTVFQVQKGLPDNRVVPVLKERVDEFKWSLPVLIDLRNESLKPRHWEQITTLFGGFEFQPEMTLGELFALRVFEKKDEVGQISLMATQEAALEELLKKVATQWQNTEFTLLPHKDSRDVYILGGVDEIIAQLEDSSLTIATIQGSRYVGPIKKQVDQWYSDLRLMSETLEELMTCQRNWLYLESIFSAPDIQKQLQSESKMFFQVDKAFKDLMRRTNDNPSVHRALTANGLLDKLQNYNVMLDKIQKSLEDYLEEKRMRFPRFYFLSNDDLIEIISQTANPLAVQPHMSKCFDNIKRLDFGANSVDILAMVSSEGEVVSLGKNLKARNKVEDWLGAVEKAMLVELRKLHKTSVLEYESRSREQWMMEHAAMIILNISQVFWCRRATQCLEATNSREELKKFLQENILALARSAALTRTNLTALQRGMLSALIVIDVHARDIVDEMVENNVGRVTDFGWIKQLRYYWDADEDDLFVRQTNSNFRYGYEYLGCQPRLVITPLTDRIYMTLTGALHLKLGGAPAGPAGTGKTETTKDLAKSLGRQCVVFNCSEGVTFQMMAKFFAGLLQTGAWICFDEFNRINIEVLSVVASQLLTIRSAMLADSEVCVFDGKEMRIRKTMGVFITMNPGYAGRTELPDNLKVLFRPVACMIPDYRMIAEVVLFSEGFENAKSLSRKMTQLYKLSSEQLSSQDHYDFGMRAVKSVLVMAGGLKRANAGINEDLLLIRAMRDSNIPKFLADDVPLFQAIVQDLFPGINIPEHDYGELQRSIEEQLRNRSYVCVPKGITKIIQLYETLNVRHGVMLVGPTGGGKTTCRSVLASALTSLRQDKKSKNDAFQVVHTHELNPKSISYAELYGAFNLTTMEWTDGIVPHIAHEVVADSSLDKKWIVFDGPVDTLWIESMNSVLDDSKLLCLDNGDRIKLTNTVALLFEVQDLSVASPATVSRCGMVYIDPSDLPWDVVVHTWLRTQLPEEIPAELRDHLDTAFHKYVAEGLKFVRKSARMDVPAVAINLVQSCCDLLKALISSNKLDWKDQSGKTKKTLDLLFVFSYVWSIGGNLSTSSQEAFDQFARQLFEGFASIPGAGSVYDYFVECTDGSFKTWNSIVPDFKYIPGAPFFKILVPTMDTVRYSFLLKTLVQSGKPVLFNGNTGVGKSVIVTDCLTREASNLGVDLVSIQFSAQTSAGRTQEMIETKLEKKRKNVIGAAPGKKVVLFVDDLNMPMLETYGAQPPIELLRQMIGGGGFWDAKKLFWKYVQDVTLVSACGPPGGGRNPTTPRLLRFFHLLCIPDLAVDSMKKIFVSILGGFLDNFSADVKNLCKGTVNASIEMYSRISLDLRPTPARSHYTFNLRDLSKVFQGIMQVTPRSVNDVPSFCRLWIHESTRCFHDRLIDSTDRTYFKDLTLELVKRHLGQTIEETEVFNAEKPLIFGDFMKMGVPREERMYELISDLKRLSKVLEDYLDDFNMNTSKQMNLVFFADAISHVTRIARIVRQERGNAVLVGVSGSGKQSLTRLAAAMNDFKCVQIELARNYGLNEFREDLKKLYSIAGVEGKPVVFLLSDNQIVEESFLEDVNNILNSGEVPNLFPADEKEKIINDTRAAARDAGAGEGRDAVYSFFISRVRENLHIVLCMSPVGDAFRTRIRKFPSLVNCCSIDWFDEWPAEALFSVARRDLEEMEVGGDNMRGAFASMCVEIHSSVSRMAHRFYQELRRRFYVTPTSYLEFIKLYRSMLDEKREELSQARDRLKNGLTKLRESNELVAVMRQDLEALQPILIQKTEETAKLLIKVSEDTERANVQRKQIAAEEAIVNEKTAEAEAIAADAQKDLDEALPALEKSLKALDSLNKNDITEMKAYKQPPKLVVTVMEAVCTLRNEKKTDWDTAKVVLGNAQFLKECKEFDKDNIPDAVVKKLQKFIKDPEFEPETVGKQSLAAKSLCMWIIAIDLYNRVAKNVEPKRQALNEAKSKLEVMQAQLAEKRGALNKVESELKELQRLYQTSMKEKADLEMKLDLSEKRLARAGKLTSALASEQERWSNSVQHLDKAIIGLPGSIFLSAASVAYSGPFTAQYRKMLVDQWTDACGAKGIDIADDFSLVGTLSNPVTVREWAIWGLPTDNLSIENGILVARTRRWPLMIDPQGQANRWIRNMEAKNGLKVIKRTEAANALRTLENAVRIGQPVLMEDVGEELDPALEPLLMKQVFKQGQRLLIRLGDSDVDYDPNFRFYMTTKLQNPHYLPEVCIKVTLINFTVTRKGLEDQLLAEAVRKERPDLEEKKDRLITSMAADKKQLKDIEDKILKMLNESEGELLDNEALINTLNDSKVTSGVIAERVAESEEMEIQINASREEYRPLATRGSILYFVMADLSMIDPMYQYSLDYFKKLFILVIDTAEQEKSTHLPTRLRILQDGITSTVYNNVCRGLFEKDKTIFSFLICCQIKRENGSIPTDEWNFMTRGSSLASAVATDPKRPPNVDPSWISEDIWNSLVALDQHVASFKGLLQEVAADLNGWKTWYLDPEPHNAAFPAAREQILNHFQRLLLTKAFREEKFFFAVSRFVLEELGKSFIESPPFDLSRALADSAPATPIIFILSPGADPTSTLLRFAKEKMNYGERTHIISLGQGQGPNAMKLIQQGRRSGDWVVLQNCHLGVSFMPDLERVIGEFEQPGADLHPEFRLWLTSMPSNQFPIPVLQNGVKLTTEPPKGLRANLLRSYGEISPEYIESFASSSSDFPENQCTREFAFKKLLFGLCFFHALIQERRKFGPLGWNIRYEFNSSDLEVSQSWLKMFLSEQPNIPWESLRYIIGEVNYGGRVTDNWDRRCLNSILKFFFNNGILSESYHFSPSGVYYAPQTGLLTDYVSYVEQLPFADDPQVFGMHENANIVFQQQESSRMLSTVLLLQPRAASVSGSGKTSEEVVDDIATDVLSQLPALLSEDEAAAGVFEVLRSGVMDSLSTVLSHEMVRFNKLLRVVKSSLEELKKALKGLVVLSAELDMVVQSLLNNQVPKMWASVAYPSLKGLAAWVKDLVARVEFVRNWLVRGQPNAFWMSGLFFPQGFLTGVLQSHARKYKLPIDSLGFKFVIFNETNHHAMKAPQDGVLVYGLFVDGGRWDPMSGSLEDALPGENITRMPIIHFCPVQNYESPAGSYACPLYKTSVRAGTLSTTGHSTNFVLVVDLPIQDRSADFFVLRGTALLTQPE